MTTKPPSSLVSGEDQTPDEEDENLLVDASDDVTVEASEDVTTEAASAGLSAVPDETPTPAEAHAHAQDAPPPPAPRQTVPTLLGIPLPSIPLPGVNGKAASTTSAETSDPQIEIASETDSDEEITRLARPDADEITRPSITDDDEEETKVEATDPLIKVDNGLDDVTTALAEQASVEREKALRRSSPSFPPSAMPPEETSDVEFADPDDANLDAERDASDSPTASYSDSGPETSPLAAAINRRPPPGAPFGRLPGPGSGSFGLSLSPAPVGQVPAPSSSPFASRLPTSTGARVTPSSPAVQIPAPSAAAPMAPRMSPLLGALFTKYSIPLVGLVAIWLATLIGGLMIGGALFSHSAPQQMAAAAPAPAPAPAPVTAPVVQPVTVQPPKLDPPSPPAEVAAEETGEPKPVVKRAAPRPQKADTLDEEPAGAPRVAARPAPKAPAPTSKPVIKKPTKAWVDPFAN
jgi:hypothetical protein